MMRIFLIFFFAIAFIPVYSQKKINSYGNQRFGYSFDYPADLLTRQPESENGDGAIFLNSKNKERLRCWGKWNQDTEGNTIDLQQRYNLDVKGFKEDKASISYKKITASYYVISGKEPNGTVFYQKVIPKMEEGAFAYLLIRYPVSEAKTWDGQIKKITGSLK
jgi:hypothetical protein